MRAHGEPFLLFAYGMVVHGTLYLFCGTSALFMAQLVLTRECEASNPVLYSACQTFALLSCLTGNLCASLVLWRAHLLYGAAQRVVPGRGKQKAPPGAIEQIAAVPYDPALFGDEDGRRYAKECPICLGAWEPEDDIRVPPCGHAYPVGLPGPVAADRPDLRDLPARRRGARRRPGGGRATRSEARLARAQRRRGRALGGVSAPPERSRSSARAGPS
ncbi:unnamed protein product [Prorocentrum cordatum]|uniref:RING-type domain-containing protein n=1 Tax=Prorocentrum cordatum TaxID=2364126 RepID=A0ABN9RIB8_9DINO|nr:unnamed protein product [Polarella glacialis]